MLIGTSIALRPVTPDDAALLAEWENNPEYHGRFFNIWPTTRYHIGQGLASAPAPREHEKGGHYLILTRASDGPVGSIGYFVPYTIPHIFKGLEIWYQMHPKHRGQGTMTQAACLLVNHLFDALPVERIQATVVVGNDASRRVLEKAGLKQEGLLRKVFFLHGRYVDMYLYAILREEWGEEQTYRSARAAF